MNEDHPSGGVYGDPGPVHAQIGRCAPHYGDQQQMTMGRSGGFPMQYPNRQIQQQLEHRYRRPVKVVYPPISYNQPPPHHHSSYQQSGYHQRRRPHYQKQWYQAPNVKKNQAKIMSAETTKSVQNSTSNLNDCFICIDVECAATGHGHFDKEPCRIVMVDYNGTKLFDKITKVPNMTDPLIEFTGLTKEEINNGVSLEHALSELHALLIQFQAKHKNGVTIIGQSPENDILWCQLKKKVHYSNIVDIANIFKTGKYRYSLRKEAYALLNVDMRRNGYHHDPIEDAKISMRLFRKYSGGGRKLEIAKNKLKSMGMKRQFPDFKITAKYRMCQGMYNPNYCWCGQETAREVKSIDDLSVLLDANENKNDDDMVNTLLLNKIKTQNEELSNLKNRQKMLQIEKDEICQNKKEEIMKLKQRIDSLNVKQPHSKLLDEQKETQLEGESDENVVDELLNINLSLKQENEKLIQSLKNENKLLKESNLKNEQLSSSMNIMQQRLQAQIEEISYLKAEKEQLKTTNDGKVELVQIFKNKNKALKDANSKLLNERKEMKLEINNLRNKIDESIVDELLNKIQTQNDEIKQFQLLIKQMIQQQKAENAEKQRLEMKNKENEKRLQMLNDNNTLLRESNWKLLEEQKEMKLEINDLRDENKKLSRDIIDPAKYEEWDYENIIKWILSLENGLFKANYGDIIKNEVTVAQLTGTDLIEMNTNDIKSIGITVFKHRKILEKHIQKLTQNKNVHVADVEGVNAPTAYI